MPCRGIKLDYDLFLPFSSSYLGVIVSSQEEIPRRLGFFLMMAAQQGSGRGGGPWSRNSTLGEVTARGKTSRKGEDGVTWLEGK